VSKGRRELSTEEKRLWRRVAESVRTRKPLPAPLEPTPPGEALKAAPAPKRTSAPPVQARAVTSHAPLADRAGEKRVRRGRVEIGATLDLHGHTQASARQVLFSFLQSAHARGERAVIVVTGVGRGGEGVLRRCLPDWLGERDVRGVISGYAQAHRSHGGAGAYYVFLKRPRAQT